MAKPMIVTLPLILLLLDVWPLRRVTHIAGRIREKLPFFALSGIIAVVTYEVQHSSGAVMTLGAIPLGLRIENALVSYVAYIVKMLWPSGLAVFYPYPFSLPAWQAAAAGAVLAGITLLVLRLFRSRPYLAAGWMWYLVTLLPVIGLVQVGTQARAPLHVRPHDRAGDHVGVVRGIASSGARQNGVDRGGSGLRCLRGVTWVQLGYWQNSETLFSHALDVTQGNAIAEHNLGSALLEDPTRLPAAITHLQAALRISPDSAQTHTDLGSALAKTGRVPEAIEQFRAALRIAPESAIVHNNLANALAAAGQLPEAIREYGEALQIEPGYSGARQNLAIARQNLAAMHFNSGVSWPRTDGRGKPWWNLKKRCASARIMPMHTITWEWCCRRCPDDWRTPSRTSNTLSVCSLTTKTQNSTWPPPRLKCKKAAGKVANWRTYRRP